MHVPATCTGLERPLMKEEPVCDADTKVSLQSKALTLQEGTWP